MSFNIFSEGSGNYYPFLPKVNNSGLGFIWIFKGIPSYPNEF